MLETVVRRSVQASAAALGAALALLPAPTARELAPQPAPPPAAPRPVDPLAAHVLERMPSLTVDDASVLASTVRSESQEAGLDPVLVLAVIGVESGWEATAVSERGARGLMQLRRGALEWAERDGGVAPGDVHDPVHNVRVGIRYLARMVEHFDDVDLALIAYNAGPTRLASYLQAVGEVPDSMWGYVRKVHREERRIRRGLMNPQVLVADAAR
ncbi:MAG TPA: lytic transglycosylase domain-containing protein [Anaeromyxobacteraceae bacterium]|nr:lytic transglycosylase domain-containing protein [Anaeromyxobacteraceae bacterium]